VHWWRNSDRVEGREECVGRSLSCDSILECNPRLFINPWNHHWYGRSCERRHAITQQGTGASSLCPNSNHYHRQTKQTRFLPAQTFYYSHHFHADSTSQTHHHDEEEGEKDRKLKWMNVVGEDEKLCNIDSARREREGRKPNQVEDGNTGYVRFGTKPVVCSIEVLLPTPP